MNAKTLISLFLLFPLFSCGGTSPSSSSSEPTDDSLTLANLGKDVCIHTDLQEGYILNEDYEDVPEEAVGTKELSRPIPVPLSWEDSLNKGQYDVCISEYPNFAAPEYYKAEENSLDVYNLKIGTTYYWKVRHSGEETWSKPASFSTEDSLIRNLYIDGMTNCRDIGGKTLKSGKRIIQGNIYRTGKADDITEEGKEAMERLGMRTEIDIRDTSIDSSPVGEDIDYYLFHMYYDDYSNYIERNCESVKKVFQVLAKEESYPLFYHCRIGTDRTGLTTYLLYGLLGAEEEDIYRDYLFSNFGYIEEKRTLHGSGVNNVQLYYEAINAFPGETLQEHCYNFLISIGLSESELDDIIRFNVEGATEEDYSVLKGYRPTVIEAPDLVSDLELTEDEGLEVIDLHEHPSSFVEAEVEMPYAVDCAIYLYGYAKRITPHANDSIKMEQDGEPLDVTAKSYQDLHYRLTAGIYVAACFADASFPKGKSTIRVTCITAEGNSHGYCLRIARMVIIPLI